MEALLFAQQFPFSEKAREHLKRKGTSLEQVSDQSIKRAALMVSRAFMGKEHPFGASNSEEEMFEEEIISFPVAKMFVSLMQAPSAVERFCWLVKKNTFNSIVSSKNAKEIALDLSYDFGIKPVFLDEPKFFVELPLMDYMDNYFVDPESKLINVAVEKGKVFLSLNEFARFLSEKAYKKVFDSLPIKKDDIPKKFHALAKSIDSQLVVIEKKNFDLKVEGKMDPNLFPPCYKALYADQLAGKKLSYLSRLSLASFLRQLGMSRQDLLVLFSKSPDFKKHLAEYHISRIYEKELSAPSCKKMAEYGLKVAECGKECTYSNPIKYYLAELRIKNRASNSKASSVEIKN